MKTSRISNISSKRSDPTSSTRALGQRAQLSIQILLVGFVTSIILSGLVIWVDSHVRSVGRAELNALAFGIAESGIEYYRWHLAHDPNDFQDGSTEAGPYTHFYYNKNGIKIGEFELEIEPPSTGSNIVTIQSTGKVEGNSSIKKIIKVKMAPASLARFAVISNSDVRFGEGTQVYGQVHSNGGIRFDGIAYNIVSSAKEEYNDPDHSEENEFGVHTHVSPADPLPSATTTIPVRTDVFVAGRRFPVPAIDFNSLTQDLSNLRAAATSSEGYYKEPSDKKGWEIVLKTNGKFDLYKVTRLKNESYACRKDMEEYQPGWGKWSIQQKNLEASNQDYPENGIIFIEDDLWVSGELDGARLTIAAGRFPDNPSTRANIIINESINYNNFDSSDSLALFAQKNILTGFDSENDLNIDAALIAQQGFVGRYYYRQQCGANYSRSSINAFGMIASNMRYGFAYTDGSGYSSRTIIYDGNMLYAPPPNFPTTGSQYEIISWQEIK